MDFSKTEDPRLVQARFGSSQRLGLAAWAAATTKATKATKVVTGGGQEVEVARMSTSSLAVARTNMLGLDL